MKIYRHGEAIDELKEKEANPKKIMYLNEIMLRYKRWKKTTDAITSNSDEDLQEKINLYAEYRNFLFSRKYRNKKTFIKERKLFETALSEFIYQVYSDLDLMKIDNTVLRRSYIPVSIKGYVNDFENLKNESAMHVATQKMRCVIGKEMKMKYRMLNRKTYFTEEFVFPLVLTETAMVLDNWLFNNIHHNVVRIKKMFPNTLAIIVAEVVHDSYSADVSDSAIDGVYIIQRQTTSMKRRDISFNVLSALINQIENHFYEGPEEIKEKIKEGIILK